jgi:proton-dependent oligopeptide transporter, POT family
MSERPKYPRQIPFIIGNEACERFSFYGMRNILRPFLATYLLLYLPEAERTGAAKDIFHTFVMGVYFFPLLGGWIADRFAGKYKTIYAFSIVYCIGHGMLAQFEHDKTGFYLGLFFIALGSGGIKPLVASFVGDQFDHSNSSLAKTVFSIFYWAINLGSLFASMFMPAILRSHGPSVAFAIPGVLMVIATLLFIAGRKRYVMVPPMGRDPHSFLNVIWTAMTASAALPKAQVHSQDGQLMPARTGAFVSLGLGAAAIVGSVFLGMSVGDAVIGLCLALVAILASVGVAASLTLENARGHHPDEIIDGVRSVLRVLIVFALVTPFWSLFDQKATVWVVQAGAMSMPSWFSKDQTQLINPAMVLLIIPFNTFVLFPFLLRRNWNLSPLRKMCAGILFASSAWVVVAILQLFIDQGYQLSFLWQLLPYFLLTFGECLVSATGLEFAYSQAPLKLKGVIMSFWNLAVTVGNLWVLLSDSALRNATVAHQVAKTGLSNTAFLMFFFALFAAAAGVTFGWYARRYKGREIYRDGIQ